MVGLLLTKLTLPEITSRRRFQLELSLSWIHGCRQQMAYEEAAYAELCIGAWHPSRIQFTVPRA